MGRREPRAGQAPRGASGVAAEVAQRRGWEWGISELDRPVGQGGRLAISRKVGSLERQTA